MSETLVAVFALPTVSVIFSASVVAFKVEFEVAFGVVSLNVTVMTNCESDSSERPRREFDGNTRSM